MMEDIANRETTITVVTHREIMGEIVESDTVPSGKGMVEAVALNGDGETIAAAEVKTMTARRAIEGVTVICAQI